MTYFVETIEHNKVVFIIRIRRARCLSLLTFGIIYSGVLVEKGSDIMIKVKDFSNLLLLIIILYLIIFD